MNRQIYQSSIAADFTPGEAFEAINQVREWWAKNIEGNTEKLNDVFTVHFSGGTFVTFKITESIPGKKIAWLVTDCYLPWLKDKTEWTGTKMSFEIFELGYKTQLRFTHLGLNPEIECFDSCSNSWSQLIRQGLFTLITTGKGEEVFLG